jgi:hypothetical protein
MLIFSIVTKLWIVSFQYFICQKSNPHRNCHAKLTFGNFFIAFQERLQLGEVPVKIGNSVRPSVRGKQLENFWTDFHDIQYFGSFKKKCLFKFSFRSENFDDHFAYEHVLV